ncbi:MAG: hypothetical protein NTX61_12605 [Bacteroidetes bacterium]|nr:hypothetical protein [Bacteroidota bacterium]
MKSAILIVFVMFFSFAGFSQGEWNNWYFGNLAGVTFNYGLPPTYLLDGQINGARAVAMASDSLGNLLFYTNGANVWNRNHMIMPNGSGLFTNYADQSVLIVKQIADDSSYYIFTTNGMNWPPPQNNDGLHYSVVNMRLNGGMGDVDISQKNIALQTTGNYPFLMTAARHKNNRDIWLITHNTHNSCVYLAYLITASGINFPPVQSPSLFNWINVVYMNAGYMRVSPDGSRLVYPFADTVEVCRFDNETGAINPKFRIQTGNHYANEGWDYLEFSVNSKYLYNSADDWTNAKIYQYNATLTDSTLFKQSETLIGESPYGVHLQMGPDFKIYGDQSGNDSLCVINNPNSGGIACNFQPDAVYLDHRICSEGLPQFLQRYLAIIADSGHCQYQLVYFTPHIWPPPDSVYWDFGDPASGGANTSNIVNATHIYNLTGSYHISLFVRHIDMRIDTTSAMITILPGVTTSLGPDQTVCEGDSVTFDAGACSNCSYIWSDITAGPFIIGYGQTFKTGDPGIYKVIVTNSNGCNATDTIQLIVNLTPSVTNDPLSKNVCSGEPENISLTSTVTGTNFYWTPTLTSGNITGFSPDSGLVINQTLINIGATPGVVTYHIIPKVGNCPGDAVDFQVTVTVSDSVKIVISASDNDVCSGTMVTFTAIPVNQGTTPQYQWKVNGINTGTNLPGFTYVPLNSDVVTCVLTSSNLICMTNNPATSTAINMVVNPNLPVSITISPSINPVCTGNSVTFTAIAIHGGAIPSFQWKVNGVNAGTDNTSYSFIPNNGDVVTCGLTSDALCATGNPATSNSVTMTVNPNLPVSVSISASANPFCQGASVTLTATPTNGGTIPSYQWKVNGLTIGTNNPVYSDSPNNGDVVFCELNSSVVCPISNPATSNTITMVENTNLPVGVSINASTNPVCSGNSVTFTAIPANGGSSPSYQWKVNGVNTGPNNPVFIYNPVNGDCISCILTSNLVCASGNPATSNSICMTVNPNLPVSITISTPITTICAGTQVTFTASPANQGTLPQYQWKVNGVGVGTSNLTYSYIPLNGDQVSFDLCFQ